jgi:hypothetical protein
MSRETEQNLPRTNDESYSQNTLAVRFSAALIESKNTGVETYGTALQPFNGRDSDRDAWEEYVDLGVYMENLHRERKVMIELLHRSREQATLTQHHRLARRIGEALLGMGESLND